jgi:hypothetical protein
MTLPYSITRSLWPTFVPARLVCLAVRQAYAITLFEGLKTESELTFAHLRYSLGGDRPSQTTHHTLSAKKRKISNTKINSISFVSP